MLSELETRRKIFHMLSGFVIVALIYYNILNTLIMAVIVFFGALLSLFVKRQPKIPILYWMIKKFDRRQDIKQLPGKGALFYGLGVLISLVLFEKNTAMASIIILALGDSIAPLVGQYGSIQNPFHKKKFLEGTAAGIIASTLGAMIFVPMLPALLASIAAMIVEGITIKIHTSHINDNISIPVVAGFVIWFTSSFI